jgi:ribosomal-protein-serine acetyltransferase
MKIIVDNNIHLKEISHKETISFYSLIKKNSLSLREFMPKILLNNSLYYTFKVLHSFRKQNQKGIALRLGIYNLKNLIGYIALKNINKFDNHAEVSYWIDSDFSGKGITTKCLRNLIYYSFNVLKLNKLILLASTLNFPSNRIALKLGFKLDGLIRKHELINCVYHDINSYSLLKNEFLNDEFN